MSDDMSANEKKDEEEPEKNAGQGKEFIHPLDFSSLVLPFYSQAMLSLETTEETTSPQEGQRLDLAKRLIDLLDLLREKTRGNLTSDEEAFLDSCLAQLKMNYLKKAKIIKL